MFGIITGIVSAAAAIVGPIIEGAGWIGLAIEGLKAIGAAFIALAQKLDLIKPETQVDELGDKALQAAEADDPILPENFDTYQEYVDAVAEYELDEKKSMEISEKDKIAKGMELATGLMLEKYNGESVEQFCTEFGNHNEFFTQKMAESLGDIIKENSHYITDIADYVGGKVMTDEKFLDVEGVLKTAAENSGEVSALENLKHLRRIED